MPEEVTVERIDLAEDGHYYFEWIGTSRGDTITGYAGEPNMIYGGDGSDLLSAAPQNETKTSYLFGGAGDDTLKGGLGLDYLAGGPGADVMIGGRGGDFYVVNDPGDVVIEKLAWSSGGYGDEVFAYVSYSLVGTAVKRLTFVNGAGAANGTGNQLDNIINGNQYANILDGGKGIDTLYGDDGDDTYLLRHRHDRALEEDMVGRPTDGHDTVLAFNSFKLSRGIEDIVLQDVIGKTGQPVQGLTAIGNLSDNLVVGNAYDNILQGLQGNDTLTGGAGVDDFVFNRALATDNIDLITDFGNGDDRIIIRAAVLSGMTAGVLADDAFHLGADALTVSQRFLYDGQTLWFDADGTGSAQKLAVALFDGTPTLTAGDIFIV